MAAGLAGRKRAVGTVQPLAGIHGGEGWNKPVAELCAEVARRISVRRLGRPIDIAHAAAFLLSDQAGYIDGTSIVVRELAPAVKPVHRRSAVVAQRACARRSGRGLSRGPREAT